MREKSEVMRIPVSLAEEVRALVSRHRAAGGRGAAPKAARTETVEDVRRAAYLPVESMTWDADGKLTSHTFPLADAAAPPTPEPVVDDWTYVPDEEVESDGW